MMSSAIAELDQPSRVACSDLLAVFMSAHSTLAPSDDPQNDSNDEKSPRNKIKCPTRNLHPIDAHAIENHHGVSAGPDDRQIPTDAEPDT